MAVEIAGEHEGLLGIGVLGGGLGPGSMGGDFGGHLDPSGSGDSSVTLPALDLTMGACALQHQPWCCPAEVGSGCYPGLFGCLLGQGSSLMPYRSPAIV